MSQAFTDKKIEHIFTTKCIDSEPVVYQTQNTARKIQQQDREKN